MHTNNPFNNGTNNQIVDRLIGRSYEVVKAVYLNLPIIKDLHDSESFDFIFNNWTLVKKLIDNEKEIQTISNNIQAVLDAPSWVDKTKEEGQKQIQNILSLSGSEKESFTALVKTKSDSFIDLFNTKSSNLNTLYNSLVDLYNQNHEDKMNILNSTGSDLKNDLIEQEALSSNNLNSLYEQIYSAFVTNSTNQIDEHLEAIREAASKAMFSYRYCNQKVESFQTYPIRILQPTSEIKVGDHIVTWQGEVYEITAYDPKAGLEGEFTVGEYLHSLRGARGEKGETGTSAHAVTIQGWCHTKAEFDALNIQGKEGWAWLITNDDTPEYDPSLMVWIPTTKEWIEQKNLQGPPGRDANELLMDPDPLEYFIHVYGYTLQEYYGMLLVTIKDDQILENASYSSYKVDQLLKGIKADLDTVNIEVNNRIDTTNANLEQTNTNLTNSVNTLNQSISTLDTKLTTYVDTNISAVNTTITNEINNLAVTLENNTDFKTNIENQVNQILNSKDLSQSLATDLDSLKIKFDTYVMHSNGADFVKMFEDTLSTGD